MDIPKCHVCGATSTIQHAPHCSFRGLPEHRRIMELERALNRLGGSPPPVPFTFAQLAMAQEHYITELERERDELKSRVVELDARLEGLGARVASPARRFRCPDCGGIGAKPSGIINFWCQTCGGTGAVMFDPETERKKGSA